MAYCNDCQTDIGDTPMSKHKETCSGKPFNEMLVDIVKAAIETKQKEESKDNSEK